MRFKILFILFFFLFIVQSTHLKAFGNNQSSITLIQSDSTITNTQLLQAKYKTIFKENKNPDKVSFGAFMLGYVGFLNLIQEKVLPDSAYLLTICDFNLSANKKRLWVIDLKNDTVLFHSLVSHGKNTGEEYAVNFSNKVNSYQSSLGFYKTANTYEGSNGFSLRLIGLDQGINSNAYDRAIVMHGADYCSEDFILENNRLGRSFGCPAVPKELAEPILQTIKDQQCLYIHYNDPSFSKNSKWIAQFPTVAQFQKFQKK